MFIYVGDPIGGSHGFPGWVPMGGHGVSCSPGIPLGFARPPGSRTFLVSWCPSWCPGGRVLVVEDAAQEIIGVLSKEDVSGEQATVGGGG